MKENNCLNCENFAFWDGDYCCLAKFVILDEGDENNDFTEDILRTMKTEDECVDYKKSYDESIKYKEYKKRFKKLLDKEYNKKRFKKLLEKK